MEKLKSCTNKRSLSVNARITACALPGTLHALFSAAFHATSGGAMFTDVMFPVMHRVCDNSALVVVE
jgi:hypothetical protein